mgnify:CR=1 FL=1
MFFFFFQAEDGIRDLVRSRGLGDVYKRQRLHFSSFALSAARGISSGIERIRSGVKVSQLYYTCLLYTSDAADDLLCVDLGGRRVIKKKQNKKQKKINTPQKLA